MSLHKAYKVVRAENNDVLEEFATLEAAEEFMILMQGKGEQVRVLTDKEDEVEAPQTWDIEGLELEEPSVDFGSELDDEFTDPGFFEDEDSGIEFD